MHFAPSWGLLAPFLERRRAAGGELGAASWNEYVAGYTAKMRRSYVEHRRAWDELLAREEATLVCFCTNPTRCHRDTASRARRDRPSEIGTLRRRSHWIPP